MKKLLLLPLALLLTLSGVCQTTKARSNEPLICIPQSKARQLDADIPRYKEALKENGKLRESVRHYAANDSLLREAIVAKDTALAATTRRVSFEQVLRQDAEARGEVSRLKAKKRGWVNGLLVVILSFVTYTAIAR